MARLYDPHGLLAPVTVCGKMMLQDMWKLDCPWDAQVPEFILESWNNFREGLVDIESIQIPRCIQQNTKNEYYLLGFCDASMRAYSAVVYFGTLQNGILQTSIIAAKTRPAPVKSKSLPRLELCGAVLLVRLLEAVKNAFAEKPLDVAAWTDSRIVLEWLKVHPGTWDTFVANRVAEVQESLPFEKWRHVRGVENPADCASRGISAKDLVKHPLWWRGPSWLSRYPNLEVCEQVDLTDAEKLFLEAKRNVHAHHTIKDDFTFLRQYSSLPKLLYVTAYCRQFLYNCQAKKSKYARKSGPISLPEYKESLSFWIAQVQKSEFVDELKSLRKGVSCGSSSKLLCLNPFLDENGLARVGGRLRNSKLPEYRKHPILLPKNNPLTDMIINYEHQIQLHAGPQLLLACLQRKYWILGARDRIKYWVKKCVVCTRHRGEALSQMMADLPCVRVNPVRPFLRIGMDYIGPVLLKEFSARSRKEFKGYVVVFVCMATRAIHIELARSLSSPAFIATLKRFMARRGKPCEMFSDCGRTFVGTAKELRFLHEKEHLQSVSKYLTTECIKFQFNLPAAPHFGGLWEAGIKSIKYHLRRVTGNTKFNYDEMETLLFQIESCLNYRPISAMSSDPEDLEPLTPGHFLIGDALTAIPEENYREMTKLTRWQLVQKVYQDFWRRWSSEFLTRLQQRPKWWTSKSNVEVGALVLIKDERLPPLKWKMGRITEVHSGSDGLVRVASLRTADGIIKRPITKLCLLPIDNAIV